MYPAEWTRELTRIPGSGHSKQPRTRNVNTSPSSCGQHHGNLSTCSKIERMKINAQQVYLDIRSEACPLPSFQECRKINTQRVYLDKWSYRQDRFPAFLSLSAVFNRIIRSFHGQSLPAHFLQMHPPQCWSHWQVCKHKPDSGNQQKLSIQSSCSHRE